MTDLAVWAPLAQTVQLETGGQRLPCGSGPAAGGRRRTCPPATTTRSCSTTATRCPTHGRPGSRTACTARAGSSTTARSPGPTGAGAACRCTAASSTSCTSARSAPRARSTASSRQLDHLVDLGVDLVELMPVDAFPGRWRLGLRRRRPLRRARPVRRPGGSQAARRRLPRPRARRGHRRRLQPPRARGQLPAAVRPLLHRPAPHAVGLGGQLRRRRLGRGAAVLHRQRADVAARLPRRRPAPRRRPRHRRHLGDPPAGRALRGGRRPGGAARPARCS